MNIVKKWLNKLFGSEPAVVRDQPRGEALEDNPPPVEQERQDEAFKQVADTVGYEEAKQVDMVSNASNTSIEQNKYSEWKAQPTETKKEDDGIVTYAMEKQEADEDVEEDEIAQSVMMDDKPATFSASDVLAIRQSFVTAKKYDTELAEELSSKYGLPLDTIEDIYSLKVMPETSIPRNYPENSQIKVTNKKLKLYGATGTIQNLKNYVTGKYTVNINGRTVTMIENNFELKKKDTKPRKKSTTSKKKKSK